MSIKKYFEIAENIQSLANKSAQDIGSEVESVGYHEQDIIEEERFIPRIDFSKPENFARYGMAEEYYESAIKRIYNTYPYDGSLQERLKWVNESTYLDLYIYDEKYPRTTGYIILSAGGSKSDTVVDGYGRPSVPEYIYVKGGPNVNPNGMKNTAVSFTGSNYYEPSMNRGSNLELNLSSQGASLEFWLKKSSFPAVAVGAREVIFDVATGAASSSAGYGRFRLELSGNLTDGSSPVQLTAMSGATGIYRQSIAATTFTSASIADNKWHHYAVTVKSSGTDLVTKFYVDGYLNKETTFSGKAVADLDSTTLRGYVGALSAPVSGATTPSSTAAGDGKLAASLDEFRYWKTQRTSKDIGRFWFTQVGGGVNTDPEPFIETLESGNVDLGVYYKFNEGITGQSATDSVVLDYSGRVSNGAWTGYSANSRNTGSAIVSSSAAIKEFHDPIIYSFHPDVVSLNASLKLSGSAHDVTNNAAVYNSIPAWITEEDQEGQKELLQLTQIMSSYLDTAQLQIQSLNKLRDKQYPSGSDKPLPFAEKLLVSQGFIAPDLFLDADLLEKLADRSEDRVYEKSLHDIKNTIYQNIYNNLTYIYKTKGTEKSFRNLIRCFGVDEELIKLNMYGDNISYTLENNRKNVVVADKFVDFNTAESTNAVVYSYADASNANSVGAVPVNSILTGGYAVTMETEILFPRKMEEDRRTYVNTNVISSSLFGMHSASATATNTTWAGPDTVNFQVYAERDEVSSTNAKFVLTSSTNGLIPRLTSSLIQDLYNNNRWNLAVRIKPAQYPLAGLVNSTSSNYIVELHGVQADSGEILEEFTVSQTITAPTPGFVTGSRRAYIGAHRTNFTGAVLQSSDVKVNACRFWLDYLDDDTLRAHILDTENHGPLQPHLYAFGFNTWAQFGDVKKADTLVFNWEFLQNTGSNALGQFLVNDLSSGSANLTRFGSLGNILNKQYTASGSFFKVSSTDAIDKDFVVSSKLNLPEHVESVDMVQVVSQEDTEIFTSESRPINYYYAFEKSMYQVISTQIINHFANLKDFHNLIGEPAEKYRPDYKKMQKLRQRFFETVRNTELDFDKFYEYYKWFDSSLSVMLAQLVPASADFADNILNVIENHVLERPKYRHKFPFIEKIGTPDPLSTTAPAGMPTSNNIYPMSSPDGNFGSNDRFTKRQLGSSNPPAQNDWKKFHAPEDGKANKNAYWHRYREEPVDSPRKDLMEAIKQTYNRRLGTPVKFTADASSVVAGVGRHPNNRPDYVFAATAPYGPTVPDTNIPKNVMFGYGADVEELIPTTDEYFPSQKQRLGFGLDPGINHDPGEIKMDGNIYAPFSLYSSSVTTGYNDNIVRKFKSGSMVTNLHNDFVGSRDIPMQGPFPEKFVGGRFYRHTEVNPGTDTRENRAEGFRIEVGSLALPSIGYLGVVPPNYPFGDSPPGSAPSGFLPRLPTAQRLRDESAKRPVNIKNILMTTASAGVRLSGTITHGAIGNYQKNYQVINTAGRMVNDPFFKDQTFKFAPYPETLATRGRFPLYLAPPLVGKSYLFDGSNDYAKSKDKTASDWNTLIGSSSSGGTKAYSMSVWIYVNNWAGSDSVMSIGRSTYLPGGREITLYDDGGGDLGIRGIVGGLNYRSSDTAMTTGRWYHITVTYAGMAAGYGGTTVLPLIYVNGADDGDSGNTSTLSHVQGIGTFALQLGNASTPSKGFFDGYMCDVAVYNKQLSAAEVTELYNGGQRFNPLNATFSSNVITYLPMGNMSTDSATVITDLKGFDNLVGVDFTSPIKEVSPSALSRTDFAALGGGGLPETTANTGGALNYMIPQRTGSDSQDTVIVCRYAGSGYEVMSLGYMDPAHTELSVYNASPYHNLAIIDHGLSGSASVDPIAAKTITVVDQIDKNRGLDQRATLHCGKFGADSAYGTVTADTYVTVPSWHKTNSNRRRRMDNNALENTMPAGNHTASVYDNLYVQHAIPQSTQQYTWVTGSLIQGKAILGLTRPLCFSASVLNELVTSGAVPNADFVGLRRYVLDPVSASSHILGFPLTAVPSSSYYNSDLGLLMAPTHKRSFATSSYLNTVINNRGGAFGYSSWKQLRVGEGPVARTLRKANKIGTVVAPPTILNKIAGKTVGAITPTQPNTFADYFEAPIAKNASPINFYFEDNTENSDPANNINLTVPYRNSFEYFTNNGLNNRLGLEIDLDTRRAYNSAVDFTLNSNLSVIVNYSERVYPAAQNAYKPEVRARQNYTINNIWNDSRDKRSTTYGGQAGPFGQTVANASTWPMDGHINFTTTSSVKPADGAGILMNSYSRLSGAGVQTIHAAPTYAMRTPIGDTTYASNRAVFVGDAQWLAGAQSKKNPYQNYTTYAEHMRLVGKDYSIVPEFRISEHIATYVNENESDFLASIDSIFDLTGAAVNNSSDDIFYKTYTNGDFLRYFGVIDDDLNEQRSENLKIVRDKVVLKCDALVKFLPYKGFYPAERTVELARLLSQSYGRSMDAMSSSQRIFFEPLYSPGIMYNTIKSGLAVGNFVVTNTASSPESKLKPPTDSSLGSVTHYLYDNPSDIGVSASITASLPIYAPLNDLSIGTGGRGYVPNKVPFEALYRPESFFSDYVLKQLPNGGNNQARLYDTGPSGSLSNISFRFTNRLGQPNASEAIDFRAFGGDKLYTLAIDNFLCETANIFVDKQAYWQSSREENFKNATSGTTYIMQFKLYRTATDGDADETPDTNRFTLYNNELGFGTPLIVDPNDEDGLTLQHVSPPYYGGPAAVGFQWTATRSGIPTLEEIFGATTISYGRQSIYGHNPGNAAEDIVMHVDSCFNFFETLQEVPPGTVTQKDRWLIQSKFETPILNFAGVSSSVPPTSSVFKSDSANDFRIKGMWHQYGSVPTGSNEGVFALIDAGSGSTFNSLADIVGFPVGKPVRIGTVNPSFKLEEALVAIPYRDSDNRRRFIKLQDEQRKSQTYLKAAAAMQKYVFPPKFDFTRFDTVDPLLMYVFEFSADLSQQDITDIWQNVSPSISEKFQTKEAVVEEQELLDLILTKDTDTKWMVFKVKKRAKKDFEIQRRAEVQRDVSALSPNIESKYSYNWPYDYFSLVELAKMEEKVQYASRDLAPPAPTRTGDDTPPPAIASVGASTLSPSTSTSGAPGSAASLANPEQAVTTRAPQTQTATAPTTTRVQQTAATTTAATTQAPQTTTTQAPRTTRTTRGRGRGGGGRGGSY